MEYRDTFKTSGFLRLKEVLKIIPVSKSTWWNKVHSGEFPQPIKLGARTTVWRKEDIYQLVESFSKEGKDESR